MNFKEIIESDENINQDYRKLFDLPTEQEIDDMFEEDFKIKKVADKIIESGILDEEPK